MSVQRLSVAFLMVLLMLVAATIAVPASAPPAATADELQQKGQPGISQPQVATVDSAPLAASLTQTDTVSIFLPLAMNNEQVRPACSPDSPFSLQIAALHEVEPNAQGILEEKALTEEEWLALYQDSFPTLLDALEDSGACWSRVRIVWDWIEPDAPVEGMPPAYYWGPYHDENLALVAGTGVQLIGTIDDVPDWAADEPFNLSCSPIRADRLDEFARFVTDLVNRYKQPPWNIHVWELRNEPDGTTEDRDAAGQGCGGLYGAKYAQMAAAAYPAIKAADPTATVLMGGVAYDNFTEYDGPFYRYFPDNVMSSGGAQYMDAITLHYFADFFREWERWVPYGDPPTCGLVDDHVGTPYDAWGIDIIAKANHFRNRLAVCHGVNKPLWITELAEHGYPDQPDTLYQQARYVIQGHVRSLAVGAENVTWFALVSPPYDTAEQGLLTQGDLSPKPAYYAYQTLTSELRDYEYVRPLNAQNAEGYVFRNSQGQEKTVAWSWGAAGTSATVAFAQTSQLRRVDRLGNATTIQDGGAGDADGIVNGTVVVRLPNVPLDTDPEPPRYTAEPYFFSK